MSELPHPIEEMRKWVKENYPSPTVHYEKYHKPRNLMAALLRWWHDENPRRAALLEAAEWLEAEAALDSTDKEKLAAIGLVRAARKLRARAEEEK